MMNMVINSIPHFLDLYNSTPFDQYDFNLDLYCRQEAFNNKMADHVMTYFQAMDMVSQYLILLVP